MMLHRFATMAAVCMLVPVTAAPLAFADPPPPDPAVQPVADAGAPPPPDGAVPSATPGALTTPDGWVLAVSAKNETQLPVAPLTTALSSREYLVGGTFNGTVKGPGKTTLTGGTLEAGYQIGCGINGGPVELLGGIGISPGFNAAGTVTSFATPITGQIKIGLKPGTVTIVPVDKKSFKGTDPRVTITGLRVKVDGCVGQSFLRSYATLTNSTDNTDDVITYLGVTKVV